jgi:protein phosphatase
MMESHGITDTGCVRSENQDRILTDANLGLFVVADGMGGHSHGERAAELAVATLAFYLESSSGGLDVSWPFGYNFEMSVDANRLATAIQLANRQVWNHAQQAPECAGMGTTVAAVLARDDRAVVGNVGDSRVYLWRRPELRQISFDDTFINSIAQRDGLAAKMAPNHPMRNVLTQAAGMKDSLDIHIVEMELLPGDLYLICSDGLHGVIGDDAIRSILEAHQNIRETAARLNEAARVRGAPDNISCVLLSYNL